VRLSSPFIGASTSAEVPSRASMNPISELFGEGRAPYKRANKNKDDEIILNGESTFSCWKEYARSNVYLVSMQMLGSFNSF
jgi:hypothetical protein